MIIYYAAMKIKTKRYYIYYLAIIGSSVIAILPIKVGLFLADIGGWFIYTFFKKYLHISVDNLISSFPDKSREEAALITKRVFTNMCRNAIEWISIYKLNKKNVDKWITIEGLDKVDRALSKGKGMLMLASHFGNWELISIYFRLKDYPGAVIARRIYFNKYDKFITRLRGSKTVDVIYRDESPKKMLKVLKNNGIMGILADQDMDSVEGIFVDFFGKPTYTAKAPVALALASGAALLPCFIVRENSHHRLIIEDPIELTVTEDKEETIKINTQKWSKVIESYIRKYPDQWVWFHKRWKTKPGLTNRVTTDKATSNK